MKWLVRGVIGGQSKGEEEEEEGRKGKRRKSKEGWEREKQRVSVFQVRGVRRHQIYEVCFQRFTRSRRAGEVS